MNNVPPLDILKYHAEQMITTINYMNSIHVPLQSEVVVPVQDHSQVSTTHTQSHHNGSYKQFESTRPLATEFLAKTDQEIYRSVTKDYTAEMRYRRPSLDRYRDVEQGKVRDYRDTMDYMDRSPLRRDRSPLRRDRSRERTVYKPLRDSEPLYSMPAHFKEGTKYTGKITLWRSFSSPTGFGFIEYCDYNNRKTTVYFNEKTLTISMYST